MRGIGLIAALALAAGCGSNAYDSSSGTGTVTCTLQNSVATASVTIQGMTFNPPCITVTHPATVTFTNMDAPAMPHTATSDAPGAFDTGMLTTAAPAMVNLANAGTFYYHCAVAGHNMHGGIIVQ